MEKWRDRFQQMAHEIEESDQDTSSRFDRGNHFWSRDDSGEVIIDPGEITAWVLIDEFGGGRPEAYRETGLLSKEG
jgi:hypothetical protein